jgi:phage terminase large subunit-like protein
MKNSNTLSGVGVVGMSWTFHVAGTAAPVAHSAIWALGAIPRPKRHAAAAAVASVNRGLT